MRKRVAAKVIARGFTLAPHQDPYKDTTLERAVDKLWAGVGKRGRWHVAGSRRQTREGAVRPARPA